MTVYNEKSKIAVLGAGKDKELEEYPLVQFYHFQGAMGSFFGGLLAEKGLDVVLVDVWAEHVETINTRGLRIVGVGGDRLVKVNIHMVYCQARVRSPKVPKSSSKGLGLTPKSHGPPPTHPTHP